MRTNTMAFNMQNPYKSNALYSKKNAAIPTKTPDNVKKDIREVKKIFREMKDDSYATANRTVAGSHIGSIQDYSNTIRTQRQKAKNTSNSLKKLKYQFKNISSKILRSKTSTAARQVEGQAKREVLRLKQEKMNPDVDTEELDAAIAHAKAMERVAKKKVKHLEAEEMAKASGGVGLDIELEEELKEKDEANEDIDEAEALEEYQEGYPDEYPYDELEDIDISELLDNLDEILSNMEGISEDMLTDMTGALEDMIDEMAESMADMLEEMGLGELSEDLAAYKGDMEPEDLKMMKIKHRNKEMKEIVQADAEYLKAVFDALEKQKNGDAMAGSLRGSAEGLDSGQAMPISQVAVITGTADVAVPSIDITL